MKPLETISGDPKSESVERKPLPSPLVYPLTDDAKLVEILVDLLSESEAWVRQHMVEEENCLGKHHREEFEESGAEPFVWSEQMDRHYRNCRKYVFTLISWNRRPHKLGMRSWVAEYLADTGNSAQNILVIGDGLGFDSVHLASCGHNVSYFELTEQSIRFAKKIFAMSGSPPLVIKDRTEIQDESFDVVLCLDVLEHVPDPPSMIEDLVSYLRPGGRLIVHAPFFFVDPSCPTHLKSNRRYSGSLKLYTESGLKLVDGRFYWDPLVFVKTLPDESIESVPVSRWLKLRLGGLLLCIGRFWNFPHRWMAKRARRKRNV